MQALLMTKFLQGVRWNFIESIIYQGIYLAHSILLFKVLDLTSYGTISTIFATLYIAVSIGNFGLEQTVAMFYKRLTTSKEVFTACLKNHFLFQLLFFTGCAICYVGLSMQGVTPLHHLSGKVVLSLGILFIVEGIRKTVRTLLQYAFLNAITAGIEIISLYLYVCSVWGMYGWSGSISIESIIGSLILPTSISLVFLVYYSYTWYLQLPTRGSSVDSGEVNLLKQQILRHRIINSCTYTTSYLFSTQALVTLFAIKWGFKYAGIASLMGTISQSIPYLLKKTFSRMSNLLLAYTKTMSILERQKTFKTVTYTINQFLYATSIICIVNINTLNSVIYTRLTDSFSILLLPLLLAIPLINQVSNYYEMVFRAHEKTHIILACNLCMALGHSVSLCYISNLIFFLYTLFFIKYITYSYLRIRAAQAWNLTTHWSLHPITAVGSTIAAISVWIFNYYIS
jgi:hypothetical protein